MDGLGIETRIKKGNVCTIAGRPCMGKTVVAVNLSKNLAKAQKVLYVDTEGVLKFNFEEFNFDFIRISTLPKIIEIIAKNSYDVVIVDGFQYIKYRYAENTAYVFKTVAKAMNIAVVILSHIPRRCGTRRDMRPKHSDIKDKKMCGCLYKYSDSIIFLYRDYYYLQKNDDIMEFIEYDKGFFRKRHTINKVPFEILKDNIYSSSLD